MRHINARGGSVPDRKRMIANKRQGRLSVAVVVVVVEVAAAAKAAAVVVVVVAVVLPL